MKLYIIFFLISFACLGQVGIGVVQPSNSSLLEVYAKDKTFVPPRLTNDQMLAVSNPLISSMVFNTSRNSLYIFTSLGWKNMLDTDNSILSCKKNGGSLTTLKTAKFNFPLNNSNIRTQNNLTYEVISDGKIRIKENGVYVVSAELSVRNMPIGVIGYSISLYKNGSLISILNKNVSNNIKTEYWGTSGVMTLNFSVNDIIELKYWIDYNGSLNSIFTGFNFTKIK